MTEAYKILQEGGEAELIVKKSRFLAKCHPVTSEEEAAVFLAEIRKEFWDASHHCFAFTIGKNNELTRCSDDGEPAQTAGRPILDVLLGEDIHDVCVVVTRYFGGTLLGTGGLVRAYSGAAKAGLDAGRTVVKRLGYRMNVTADYGSVGKIQYLLARLGITVLDSVFTEEVNFKLLVSASVYGEVKAQLTEGTNGAAKIEKGGQIWYGILDREVILYDP